MKKTYEKPFAEKVEFNYSDQVVTASGTYSSDIGVTTCEKWFSTNTTSASSCYHNS